MTPANVVRRGEGLPLLVIHGRGMDHRLLLPLDDALAEGGDLERVYIDLPGCGATPALPGAGGLREMADWLDALTSELIGDGPFAVLANSMGAALGRNLVARRRGQVRGLALVAPLVVLDLERRILPEKTVLRADPGLLAALDPDDAAEYEDVAVVQDRGNWEAFAAAVLPGLRAANQGAMERLWRGYRLEERLGVFDGPALLIAGRQDHVVGFRDQLDLMHDWPRAELAVLDRAGHNVHLDRPEATRRLLIDWAGSL